MAIKLKENLLIEVLSPRNIENKYSKSLLNIKTIIKLEEKENFNIPNFIIKLFDELQARENNFIKHIPLTIIEKHYNRQSNNMNSYVNIQFNNKELNIKTNELFIELESFYNQLFLVASLIASYYNLEIKINENSKNDYAI